MRFKIFYIFAPILTLLVFWIVRNRVSNNHDLVENRGYASRHESTDALNPRATHGLVLTKKIPEGLVRPSNESSQDIAPPFARPKTDFLPTLSRTRIDMLESLSGFSPTDARSLNYDANLLETSKSLVHRDAWATSYPLMAGKYDLLMDTLTEKRRFLAKVTFAYIDGNEALGLLPMNLQYLNSINPPEMFDYSGFASPFASSEMFGGVLHFPYDAFWKVVVNGLNCIEILAIRQSWVFPTQGASAYKFQARAYCRKGLDNLLPVGQMGFSHENFD